MTLRGFSVGAADGLVVGLADVVLAFAVFVCVGVRAAQIGAHGFEEITEPEAADRTAG